MYLSKLGWQGLLLGRELKMEEELLIKGKVGMLIIVFRFAQNTTGAKPISFGLKYNLLSVLLLIQFKTALTIKYEI